MASYSNMLLTEMSKVEDDILAVDNDHTIGRSRREVILDKTLNLIDSINVDGKDINNLDKISGFVSVISLANNLISDQEKASISRAKLKLSKKETDNNEDVSESIRGYFEVLKNNVIDPSVDFNANAINKEMSDSISTAGITISESELREDSEDYS